MKGLKYHFPSFLLTKCTFLPQVYCKLTEHSGQRAPQCGVCDSRSPDPARRHPIQAGTGWNRRAEVDGRSLICSLDLFFYVLI